MSVSPWALVLDNTRSAIEAISPTYDAEQRWRCNPRGRPEGEAGRDRQFVMRRWAPVPAVEVFGGGEHQLGRDLDVEVFYSDSAEFEDRRHLDEQDLIAALQPQSTYPSGSDWALRVRQLIRERISIAEPVNGSVRVTFPVRHIWREPVQLV